MAKSIDTNERLKYVGKPLPMEDASAKVAGKVRYTGDEKHQDMAYASLLLSPIPHGKVKKIDTTRAKELPGVIEVFTFKNSPQKPYNGYTWFRAQEAKEDEKIFTDTVRYVGDRVAGVVAEDKKTANKAIELIEVEYEELSPVIDPEEAALDPFDEKEKKIGNPREVFEEIQQGELKEQAGKKDSPGDRVIVEDQVETQKIHHAAMENHVCLAIPEPDGSLTVKTPCQLVYCVRLTICEALELSYNKVRVTKTPLGGSFGGKQEVVLEVVTAFLAKATERPVQLELTRDENVLATRTRTKTSGRVKSAVDTDGNILAREYDLLVDTGAYTSNGTALTMAMAQKVFRLYRIDDISFRGRVVHTNTPVAGACRGYGSPQIHVFSEVNIDSMAKAIDMDPLELRLKNLIKPYEEDPTGGPSLGNARIIDCVKKGAEKFNWKEKRKQIEKAKKEAEVEAEAQAADAKIIANDKIKAQGSNKAPGSNGREKVPENRYKRGIGMACITHVNGFYGKFQDLSTMTLKLLEDGTAILNSGIHDLGCGTETIMKQIISETLEMEPENITVSQADTLMSPYDIGCIASRSTHVAGMCAKKVAEEVKEMFLEESAIILGAKKEEISLKDIDLSEMVSKIQTQNQVEIIATHTHQSTANPASTGANFAEVVVDTLTGRVIVEKIVAAHDIGKAINPGFVEGQIHGGIQWGMGLALFEEVEFDSKGRPKTTNFDNYIVANAPEMPEIEIILVEEAEDHGPYGAKSIGEAATVPTAPAIINAVNNALDSNLTSLPLTPEKILTRTK